MHVIILLAVLHWNLTFATDQATYTMCIQHLPPFVLDTERGCDAKLIEILRSRVFSKNVTQIIRLSDDQTPERIEITLRAQACKMYLPSTHGDSEYILNKSELIASDDFYTDQMLFCSAKQRNTDDWRKLKTITTTQLAMVIPFVLYVFITYYISKKMHRRDRFQNLQMIFWSYFRVISSVPNSASQQPETRALRFLYTAWLLFCFILTINYNTLILRVFKQELFSARIVNLEQALKEQHQLYTLPAFRPSIQYPFASDASDCPTINACLRLLQTNTHAASKLVALPASIVNYHRKSLMKFGESTVHCFEHHSAVYTRKIFMVPSTNVTAVNILLKRITRSGIYQHWLADIIKSNLQMQRSFHESSNPTTNTQPINGSSFGKTLTGVLKNVFTQHSFDYTVDKPHSIGVLVEKDFIVLYAYLFIGIACSTIGFIAEHVYFYKKHNMCHWHM